MSSPTQRSLAMLREQGWTVDIIERWIPHVNIRKDWCGFGDLLACKPGEPITLIQTTTGANLSARWHKILGIREAETWLRAGGAISIHGWSKRGPRGSRKLWECTVRRIPLLEFTAMPDEFFAGYSLPQDASEAE